MLGMLVQRFDFVDHLHYQLTTKTTLTVKPDDFHILVPPREGSTSTGAASGGRRRAPARRAGRGAGGRTARRPARHAAERAVRLEPRHRRVDRHPARPGGHRARLRRDPRRARRPRRRPARTAAPSLIVCSSYNGTPPDNAAAFCRWITGAARGCGRRRRLHGLRLRQHRVGRDLPGRADAARRRSSRRTAAGASGPAARATRPATSTPPTATGTAGSGPTWRPRSTSRPRWASPPAPPGRGCRSR